MQPYEGKSRIPHPEARLDRQYQSRNTLHVHGSPTSRDSYILTTNSARVANRQQSDITQYETKGRLAGTYIAMHYQCITASKYTLT